jgi:aryl-phospho-beta-D-glucosidase BglC (GH1 family)
METYLHISLILILLISTSMFVKMTFQIKETYTGGNCGMMIPVFTLTNGGGNGNGNGGSPVVPAQKDPVVPAQKDPVVPAQKDPVVPTATNPVDFTKIGNMTIDETFWTYGISGGQLTLNGQKCRLRGVNWSGFENKDMIVQMLWHKSMEHWFEKLKEIGINAVRIPVSAEFMEYIVDDEKMSLITIGGKDGTEPGNTAKEVVCPKIARQTSFNFDPDLDLQTPRHGFDKCMKLAYKYNMIVMIDNHTFPAMEKPDNWNNTCKTKGIASTNTDAMNTAVVMDQSAEGLFGKPVSYPIAKITEVWSNFAKYLLQYPHVFACDLKNEPHNVPLKQVFEHYDAIAAGVMAANPRVMIAIEGTGGTKGGWGNGFESLPTTPLKIPKPKLIYAPHQYGEINTPGQPPTTATDWDLMYGFIPKTDPDACLMIGEWGEALQKDGTWPTDYAKYIDKSGFDSFYWALQWTGADTKNLTTQDSAKEGLFVPEIVQHIKIATPTPTLPTFPPQK